MIDADEKDFLELLGDLFGAHSRNVKADIAGGYWKGLKHMTLGEFRACVEYDLEQLQNAPGGVARPPTVAEIWQTHRDLKRKHAAPERPEDAPNTHGDGWSVNGNQLLLAHISRKTKAPELDYAPDAVMVRGTLQIGPHTEAITNILVRAKNAWVADMREASAANEKIDGKRNWELTIQSADNQVREYLARHVRRAAA